MKVGESGGKCHKVVDFWKNDLLFRGSPLLDEWW